MQKTITIPRLLPLLVLLLPLAQPFEIEVPEDPRKQLNRAATLTCAAKDLDDDLEACEWISPQGERYTDRRSDGAYRVDMTSDDCVLDIRRLQEEDHGPWRCVLEEFDNRDAVEAYVFVSVQGGSGNSAGVEENEALMSEALTMGRAGTLTCPVSAKSRRKNFRCTWTDRFGNDYNAAGA